MVIDRDRLITRIAELAPDVPFTVADDFTITFAVDGADVRMSPAGRGVEAPDRDVTPWAAWAAARRMGEKLAEARR